MQTFLLKRKTFSWTTRYLITDESDRLVFVVKSKPLGSTLYFESSNGQLLFEIRRKFWSSRFTHHIYEQGQHLATILHRPKWKISPEYEIQMYDGDDYRIKGNKWAKDYIVTRGDSIVTEIMENRRTWAKDYFVRVYESEDPVFMLCCVSIMDRIRVRRQQAKSAA
jgi:uncharacterized protein YxjI